MRYEKNNLRTWGNSPFLLRKICGRHVSKKSLSNIFVFSPSRHWAKKHHTTFTTWWISKNCPISSPSVKNQSEKERSWKKVSRENNCKYSRAKRIRVVKLVISIDKSVISWIMPCCYKINHRVRTKLCKIKFQSEEK